MAHEQKPFDIHPVAYPRDQLEAFTANGTIDGQPTLWLKLTDTAYTPQSETCLSKKEVRELFNWLGVWLHKYQ